MGHLATGTAQHAKNRFRSRGLGACAAAVTTVFSAGDAEASIINDLTPYSTMGATRFSLDGTAFGEIELLLNVGMMGEISLSLDSPNAGMMGDSSTVEFAFFSSGMMSPDFLAPLSVGDTVDGSLSFAPEAFLVSGGTQNPNLIIGETAFAGFRFDDPAGPGSLFGFLEFTLDSSTTFNVSQVSFDDTGVPIVVGSIPEPGVALLLGLGLALMVGTRAREPRGRSNVRVSSA